MVATNQTDRPIVVYDGECGFCRRQVARLQRWDRQGRFAYVPRQEEGLEDRFPQLAEGDFATGMRLIKGDGTILVGADALHGIARRLPRFRWIAWGYRLPPVRWLARRVYAYIAANRHRWSAPCEDGCPLPESEAGTPDKQG